MENAVKVGVELKREKNRLFITVLFAPHHQQRDKREKGLSRGYPQSLLKSGGYALLTPQSCFLAWDRALARFRFFHKRGLQ